jgi:hypothetical protein
MLGHIEVDDPSAMMSEHAENEEHAQSCGGDREEVERDEVLDMIGEERPPSLGGRGAPLQEQPRDSSFGHLDAQLEEFGMNSWGAPEWIRRGHSPDQGFDLGVDGRATTGGPAGELRPVRAEATPLPPQDGVGRHDQEGLPPPGPDPGERGPEEAISSA